MKLLPSLFTFIVAMIFSAFANAQETVKKVEEANIVQRKSFVLPSGDVKPATKALIFKDSMDKDMHTFKPMTPRVYLFEDATEQRSGYGVWWCSNSQNANSWPTRAMFLSGLNGEGDYLLYFSNPNETRNGNTQRFSPSMFKKNGEVLEKARAENSPMSLKFEPKFKDGEMASIAFSYSSPIHNDFKYLTRENCEKY